MARDYLSVSGTGVPIERFFSNGPDLLLPKRKSMKGETTRQCMCLKGWLKSKDQAEFKKFILAGIVEKILGNCQNKL
jgi:hypothetical protein